jgi:hypothetical protein
MHKLIDFVCDELEDIEQKASKGELSISDVQYADTLAHLKKNLLKSEEMMEEFDEGYSSEMRPIDGTMRGGSYRGGSYRYDGGMSYARGRGRNAKRDSMGRYSSERGYSRDAADMTAELQEMMDDPKYAPVKHDIERLMRKVEQM